MTADLADIIAELRASTEGVAAWNAAQTGGREFDASLTINGDLPRLLRPYSEPGGHLTLRGSVTTLRLLAALLEEHLQEREA